MTLEELKLITSYFGAFGVGGIIGSGIMWFIVKSFVPSYLAEKGKNLATKEDINAITREVESVKHEFALQIKELEHQKTLLTEGFKSSLSTQQEFARTANAAVVDLTQKLAAGNFLISWLSWSATESDTSLSESDFSDYDKGMIRILSELVGLQASVAALDPSRLTVLSSFAEQLYNHDLNVGRARDLYLTRNPEKIKQSIALLKPIYDETLEFNKALLTAVTGLLTPAPQETINFQNSSSLGA